MAKRKQRSRNVVRFSDGIHLNIGIVIFGFIAIYFIVIIYMYFTAHHIVSYEVEPGTIEVNTSYTGLILRSETVIQAEQSGKLDYFLKDNTKAAKGTLICSVDQNGNVSEKMNEVTDTSVVLSSENLDNLKESIRDYAYSFHPINYFATYNFKTDVSGKLMEAVNLSALNSLSEYSDFAKENQTFHLYYASGPGIVAYYTDGYESMTLDQLTAKSFDKTTYQKTGYKTTGEIEAGQPVYKMITDENWQIVVKVDDNMIQTLGDETYVQIRFKEDNTTAWAEFEAKKIQGEQYLVLNLRNSMIRYAYERFVDINIMLDQQSGLKIPNSSITEKSFYIVPKKFLTSGNTETQQGLLIAHLQENGSYSDEEFTPVTIYYQTEDNIYLSQDDIKYGDLVILSGSTEQYEVQEEEQLKGVYNINKGYAVFRQIEILYQNDDYTIIKAGTEYSIMMYDHIALNGKQVSENQMI